MENKTLSPTHATVTRKILKSGEVHLLVSVFTGGKPMVREYRHEVGNPTEAVVAAALRSCGLASAWVWGDLTPTAPTSPQTPTPNPTTTPRR